MPSRSSRLLLGVSLALAIAAPLARPTAAESTSSDSTTPPPVTEEQRAAARELVDAGLTALGAADYDTAIDLFASAYRITRRPVLLFHIGQAHRLAGRIERAASYYERYLTLEPSGHVAPTARVQLAEIQAALAKLESESGSEPEPTPAPAVDAEAETRARAADLAQAAATSRAFEATQLREQTDARLREARSRRNSGLFILGAGTLGLGISALLEIHGRSDPAIGVGGVALLLVVGGTAEYLRGCAEMRAARLAVTPVIDREFTGAAVVGVLP